MYRVEAYSSSRCCSACFRYDHDCWMRAAACSSLRCSRRQPATDITAQRESERARGRESQ